MAKNLSQKGKLIKPYLFAFFIFCAIVFSFYFIRKGKSYSKNENKTVYVQKNSKGFQLIRNGEAYFVKGVSGKAENWKQLKKIGINSIRVYDTLNLASVLDSAQHYGISIMAGISLPKSKWVQTYYSNPKNTEILLKNYSKIVRKYKNHPALLAWCLGNELDWPYRPTYRHFYQSYNTILDMIKKEDPNHPVTTAITNFERRKVINLLLKVPKLDFISINTFSKMHFLKNDLEKFAWFWDAPFMITEWGVDGYWEKNFTSWYVAYEKNSIEKNILLKDRYQNEIPFDNPRFMGSYFFHWGHKFEYSDTWYGTHTSENKATSLIQTLNKLFEGNLAPQKELVFRNLLINGKKEDVFLKQSGTNTATLCMDMNSTKNYHINWKIMDEDWYTWKLNSTRKMRSYDNLLLQKNKNSISFTAPEKEGAYRLYVEINEGTGPYSYANIPFYIVK